MGRVGGISREPVIGTSTKIHLIISYYYLKKQYSEIVMSLLKTHRFKNFIKEYETIAINCQYLDDSTEKPISLDGVEIKAHANTKNGKLVDKLEATITDIEQGLFVLTPTVKKLPIGTLEIDICLIKNGSVAMSETFCLNVKKAETNPYHEA